MKRPLSGERGRGVGSVEGIVTCGVEPFHVYLVGFLEGASHFVVLAVLR